MEHYSLFINIEEHFPILSSCTMFHHNVLETATITMLLILQYHKPSHYLRLFHLQNTRSNLYCTSTPYTPKGIRNAKIPHFLLYKTDKCYFNFGDVSACSLIYSWCFNVQLWYHFEWFLIQFYTSKHKAGT